MRLLPLLLLLTTSWSAAANPTAAPLSQPSEAAVALLALGRPAAGAGGAAAEPATRSVAERAEAYRAQLAGDPRLRQEVVAKAFADAYGRPANAADLAPALAEPPHLYVDLMRGHIARLAAQPADYTQVLHRAYRLVVGRDAHEPELAYWARYDVLPYVLLVGAVEDWARRNQPGLMVTAGVPTVSPNSEYLTTARVSPAAAAELRSAFALEGEAGGEQRRASGRNVLAAGAAFLVAGGGTPFVVAGGPLAHAAVAR